MPMGFYKEGAWSLSNHSGKGHCTRPSTRMPLMHCHAERSEASIRQCITNRFFVPQNDKIKLWQPGLTR
jgi:hypothetical protein